MGKIDKEKLLKEIKLKSDDVDVTWAVKFIKNFHEEPEQTIDFDELYKEYSRSHQSISLQGFIDFLKSKNLTQPQIDMDQLRHEVYSNMQLNKTSHIQAGCPSCGCSSFKIEDSMMCSACGNVFELTRKLELPIKRTWTLKKEYVEFCKSYNVENVTEKLYMEPTTNKQYYDLKEEPDYSKIQKGSIVEVEFVGGNWNNCGYVNGITNKSISIGFHMLYNSGNSTTINFDQIESIVILKLAKE